MVLHIESLQARIGNKEILRGIDLRIEAGSVHAIMGPNGSGKSTLSYVLSGRDGYEITGGKIHYTDAQGQTHDLLAMAPEERAQAGVFLAFQYPVEIPGVSNLTFLRTALNALRKKRGESDLDAMQFLKQVRAEADRLGISEDMLKRAVNVGFSGGEKKRNEMLQMAVLAPRLAILDETDSGLDIDALKIVSDSVNALRAKDRAFLMITHYQRLLNYVVPDHVHVLAHGRILASGGPELAAKLEKNGYAEFGIQEVA